MLREVLQRHRGHVIAMNLSDPKRLDLTRLLEVDEDSIAVKTRSGRLHVPWRWIMEVEEAADGQQFRVQKHEVAVRVFMHHLIVYGGGTYVGVGMAWDV